MRLRIGMRSVRAAQLGRFQRFTLKSAEGWSGCIVSFYEPYSVIKVRNIPAVRQRNSKVWIH